MSVSRETLKCTKCGEEKEISEFYFDPVRGVARNPCKECKKKYAKARIDADPVRHAEYTRSYRKRNLEKYAALSNKRYHAMKAKKADE